MIEQSDAEKAAEEYAREKHKGAKVEFHSIDSNGVIVSIALPIENVHRLVRHSFLAGAAWAAPKCDETLIERLKKSRKIICALCKEGRPPHMSVPVQESDEDVFICDSIDMAIRALSRELPAAPKEEK